MTMQSSPSMFSAADKTAVGMGDVIPLIARLTMGWLFFHFGWMKLMNMAGATAYLANLKVPNPEFWAWPMMASEIIIGLGLIFGIATRYVALYNFIYLIIATALAHRYWEYPAAAQGNQYAHFCKNVGLMGGALMMFYVGAGRFSVDNALRKR